jgi:hypothetical protein
MAEPAADPTQTPAAEPGAGQPATPPAVDVQAQIDAALTKERSQFAEQLQAATGHSDLKTLTEARLAEQGNLQELADARAKERDTYKGKFEQAQISNALLAASSDAIDPTTVNQLLAGKAICDADGNVTIDGKPVAEAVKALLTEKPFLAKAQGEPGSGAPQNTQGGKQIARAEFEKLDSQARAQFIKDGGKVV